MLKLLGFNGSYLNTVIKLFNDSNHRRVRQSNFAVLTQILPIIVPIPSSLEDDNKSRFLSDAFINSFPPNGVMVSHKLMGIYMGVLILGVIL